MFGGRIEERLEQFIGAVADEREAWLVALEVMPDHVRLLVEVDPQFGVHKLAKAIKGRTCWVLGEEFSSLRPRGEMRLPKFGTVKFRWTRPLGGTIRNATVSRDGGRWYISFCVEDGLTEVVPNGKPPIGVDRGVAVAVATSDGGLDDRAFVTPGEAARLRRLQQRLSRSLRVHGRNRGSKRRDKVRAEIGRLHARIRNRRSDFGTQAAVRLVRDHGLVAVEGLRIKNMTASAKGTIERPGRNVRQKAGLNRAIMSKGWGGFLLKLEHAARYHGAKIEKVNPASTSQTCNACKHIAPESRESQAVFRCVACGHQEHADVNAAKNILAAGLAVTGRGDLAVGRSMKRQPPERLAA